jgi:acetylornithine deacetylase
MDVIALTRELCAVYSPTGREAAVTTLVEARLAGLGWRVARQPVSPARDNLYATLDPPLVVFCTHLDVVPPELPLAEDDAWLRGRGVCDAKGIAAAMVAAAEALRADGERRVGLLFTVGEEAGSDGAKAAAALEPRGRYLVNGEPTENRLSIGQKGALHVRLAAEGRAAHSAYPDEGVSAVDALLDTLERIRRLPLPVDDTLGPATLNVGTLAGGAAPNVIPAAASADLLFRTVSDTAPLLRSVRAALAPGVRADVVFDTPAVRAPALAGWDTTVVSYASDLPHLAPWGTGYQLGPGTIRVAHTADERIRKDDLREGVAAYVRLARQLLAEAA